MSIQIRKKFLFRQPELQFDSGTILNKKVKKISENYMYVTKEHQSNQLFNFYLFVRYISPVEKDASFSLIALITLLWHCVK